MAKSKHRKGYDGGGSVTTGGSIGAGIRQNVSNALMISQLAKMAQGQSSPSGAGGGSTGGSAGGSGGSSGGPPPVGPSGPGGSSASPGGGQQMARGGRIKHTSGPKIGKDDGLIPAQRGEYVVRKAAVKKLGDRAMATINRGKLPVRRGR